MKSEFITSAIVNKLSNWLLLTTSSITIIYLLFYHTTLVTFPWPIQYREGAILLSTDIMLHGGNPYNMELQPYFANAYGVLYNLIVLPFAWIFGSSLMLHKLVSGVFTLFTLALLAYSMKRQYIPIRYSLPMLAILYSSLLYSKTSLAEPDSTGTFLLFTAVLIPIFRNFSVASLGVSILLSGLGFFTKPYFVFGIIGVGTCLLLARQWKKFINYSIGSVAFIAMELLILNRFCDSYVINVLMANYIFGKETSKWDWIITQGTFVVSNDKFFFSAFFAAAIFYWTSARKPGLSQEQKHFINALCALVLVFIIFLGKNTGAYATYIYQMLFPFLCLITALFINNLESCRIINLIKLSLVLAMVAICLHYPPITDSFSDNATQWRQAKTLVTTHTNILNSPAIAPLLIQEGKKVYDSGHTGMFFYGLKAPEKLNTAVLNKALVAKQQFGDTIYTGITQKKFDLIMLDREFSNWLIPPVAIMDTYDYKGFLTLEMPHNNYRWQVDIWEPKL